MSRICCNTLYVRVSLVAEVLVAGRLTFGEREEIAARLMDAVPSGSFLVVSHPASDVNAEVVAEGARRYNQSVATAQTRRSFAEVSAFFQDMDLVEPGVVQCHRWHPEPGVPVDQYEVSGWAAVGRKR